MSSSESSAASTVLACGSRGWCDFQAVRDRLASFVDVHTTVFHGGAAGADRHVSAACVELGLDCYAFPPRYDEHGKAAPHVRNDQMLAQADLVVAFWDGKSRGTKSVIDKAEKLGIPVEVVRG